jgi:lysozyme
MPDARSFLKPLLGALAALTFASTLSGCGGGGPIDFVDQDYPKARDYPIHGVDVSKFQGEIDWNAVANSGVKFAWIKATEGGDHADERFQANWQGAKDAGIPRGAYHFVYWCRPPLEEITWFEQNAPVDADSLPPVLDVEATPTSKTCKRRLTQESAVADMRVMLAEMERHYGKRPIIYTTVDFYQAILADGALSDYAIWVRSTKYHPSVKYGSRPWAFWQYQSDGGVSGIRGKVDRDAFFGTRAQWEAFLREPTNTSVLAARLSQPAQAPSAPATPAPEPTPAPAPSSELAQAPTPDIAPPPESVQGQEPEPVAAAPQ